MLEEKKTSRTTKGDQTQTRGQSRPIKTCKAAIYKYICNTEYNSKGNHKYIRT